MYRSRFLIYAGMLLVFTGCSSVAKSFVTTNNFDLLAAHADVTFDVIDTRPEAEKQLHVSTQPFSVYTYGDDQFSPSRVRVLATHFAAAFPGTADTARLQIDRIQVIDSVPSPLGKRSGSNLGPVPPLPPQLLVGMLVGALVVHALQNQSDWNYITCRLSGTFDNVPFDVSYEYAYGDSTHEQRKLVPSVFLTAVTKSIEQVRKQRQPEQAIKPFDLPFHQFSFKRQQ